MTDDSARIAEHTPMQVIERVVSQLGDNIDRITIVVMDEQGHRFDLFSNAHSEAELHGMLAFATRMWAEDRER